MNESALNLTNLLTHTAEETIADFEKLVDMDATERAAMDGSVHPLCSCVVKYLKYLLDYQWTLKQLFQEFDNIKDPDTKLQSAITRIMSALLDNLDNKSKQLRRCSISSTILTEYLLNNVYYVVSYVRRTEKAWDLLGDGWVQIHRRIVQHANEYKRVSWNKTFQCIKAKSSGSSSIETESITKTLVKDKFKTFNSQFEELHQRQCQWIVSDIELRESLRLAIAEFLLPAYRSFLKRFGNLLFKKHF